MNHANMNRKKTVINNMLVAAFFVLLTCTSFAHQPGQSYLYFKVYPDRIEGNVEMTVKDINTVLDADLDPSAYYKGEHQEMIKESLPQEWASYAPALKDYLTSRIRISNGDQKVNIAFSDVDILRFTRSVYWVYNFVLNPITTTPESLQIDYNVLFDKDDEHRGLTIIRHNWKAGIINNEAVSSLIFSPDNTSQELDLESKSLWSGFVALLKLGMWHIYIGIDHIFFLLALILPSVILKRSREDRMNIKPVEKFRTAFLYILKIVTLFTIAHSITLSLAALGYIQLESRIVESIIALSIGLAALHNIYPLVSRSEVLITFLFGLFHGMGFASVLGEKGIEGEYLALSLLGFNVGVEIGQLLIVCAIFPILYFVRKTKFYKHILIYVSAFLIIASLYWVFERFFDVDLLLDNYIEKGINKIFKIIGLK